MKMKSVRQQFADTMFSVGRDDSELVVVVGDISHSILQPFADAYPGRYYNAGILEPTLMSMVAGLSRVGFHPVLHTIAPFLIERAFEQIKLDFVYHDLPGNIVTVGSAFDYANLGCTHHCYGDFALLKTLPGIQIIYPGTALEFDSLFRQAYANRHLTYFRLPGHPHTVDFSSQDVTLGSAMLVSEGEDLTIIATGPQLNTAVGVRDQLLTENIHAEVLYVHTIRPLDEDTIGRSVAKTHRVVVIEEHMESGGLGDEVLRSTYRIGNISFLNCAIPNLFIRGYGTYEDHCETIGLTVEGVLDRIQAARWFNN